jgi:hypothetical protein
MWGDNFRRWLAKAILPPEVVVESAGPTLSASATEVVKLAPVFTPTGPKVKVKRVKVPKPGKSASKSRCGPKSGKPARGK